MNDFALRAIQLSRATPHTPCQNGTQIDGDANEISDRNCSGFGLLRQAVFG